MHQALFVPRLPPHQDALEQHCLPGHIVSLKDGPHRPFVETLEAEAGAGVGAEAEAGAEVFHGSKTPYSDFYT